MAEGILKTLVKEAGWEDVRVSSAGTIAPKGYPAAQFAIDVTAEAGIDISDHKALPLTGDLVAVADMIVAMELYHLSEVTLLESTSMDRTVLLSKFDKDGRAMRDIRDPYGEPIEAYREAFTEIRALVEELFRFIEALGGDRIK